MQIAKEKAKATAENIKQDGKEAIDAAKAKLNEATKPE